MRKLLDAVMSVGSELDVSAVLLWIVEAAVELFGARYGALGAFDESRTRLVDFITVTALTAPADTVYATWALGPETLRGFDVSTGPDGGTVLELRAELAVL